MLGRSAVNVGIRNRSGIWGAFGGRQKATQGNTGSAPIAVRRVGCVSRGSRFDSCSQSVTGFGIEANHPPFRCRPWGAASLGSSSSERGTRERGLIKVNLAQRLPIRLWLRSRPDDLRGLNGVNQHDAGNDGDDDEGEVEIQLQSEVVHFSIRFRIESSTLVQFLICD